MSMREKIFGLASAVMNPAKENQNRSVSAESPRNDSDEYRKKLQEEGFSVQSSYEIGTAGPETQSRIQQFNQKIADAQAAGKKYRTTHQDGVAELWIK